MVRLLTSVWLLGLSGSALAIDVADCRRTFDSKPTELAWCLASVGDKSKCKSHPKLEATEEKLCTAIGERSKSKCGTLFGAGSPNAEACEAMVLDRYADCDNAITDAATSAGGDELDAAKAVEAFCNAFLRGKKDSYCSKMDGDFRRDRCEWMVAARLVVMGAVAPVPVSITDEQVEEGGDVDLATVPPEERPGLLDGRLQDWVKEEYRKTSMRTLIVSMTPDGKIGSVYFEDGRIRTVHDAGPERERTTLARQQFNITEKEASRAFYRAVGKRLPYVTDDNKITYWRQYDRWVLRQLSLGKVGSFPAWATYLAGPKDALKGLPDGTVRLLEIFYGLNGQIESWHPSRGAAVAFETNQQVVSVLEKAVADLDEEGITDPQERNIAFYAALKKAFPELVETLNIRDPNPEE